MALPLVENVQDPLATERFGRSMRGFEEVGSTNEIAADWAADGAPEGAVVVAEYQATGRGRQGRTWSADKGHNLLFSVILRPELASDQLSLITVAAVVGVAEAVEEFVRPHGATIKWPNDVLLEGRKTCGILLESSLSAPSTETVVILGVGLNVNQDHFPDNLAETATSLRLTTGRIVPRPSLFAQLLQALERRYDEIQGGKADTVRAAYESRLASLDEPITLRLTGTDETVTGTVEGVGPAGALRLRTENGRRTMHAGEVTTRSL